MTFLFRPFCEFIFFLGLLIGLTGIGKKELKKLYDKDSMLCGFLTGAFILGSIIVLSNILTYLSD